MSVCRRATTVRVSSGCFSTASAPPSRNNNKSNEVTQSSTSSSSSSSNQRPSVFVAGPFQSRINVADPVLPSNATQRERVNYYTKKASWTALGAALVAVGVAAVGVFLFDDVEFFQPRYGSTALMRKALAAMNAHAPFLKLIGRVTADPGALARETIPASARGSQASASQLVSRYKRQGDQVKFHFRVDAPNGLVFATVEARHNKTTGDYDLFSLVLDIPQHRKRMVVIREFAPTARRSSPA